MYKKQIVVVAIVIAIMGYLSFQTPMGLIKAKGAQGHTNTTAPAARPVVNVTVAMVSSAAKINDLEGRLKNAASDDEKRDLQKKLAKSWDDVNQAAPAAFYYQAIAGEENTFGDWVNAGNHFNDAFKFTQDTVAQPAYVVNAITCFKNAVKLQP